MKTYSAERIHWLKHHVPTTRDEYLEATTHANAMPPVFPRTLYLEIGARCNLDCTFCSKPTRRTFDREMDQETIFRVIDECAKHGLYYLAFHDFGEPLLHVDRLLPAIAHAKKVGIPVTAVTTNITPLTEKVMRGLIDAGLDSLHLSYEGANPALYERVRGVKFNVITERILHAVHVRSEVNARDKFNRLRPWMAITSVRTEETDQECTEFMERWKGIVDDLEVRPALEYLNRTQFKDAFVPAQRIPCRYVGDRLIIVADGTITTCSVDLDAELALGNVMDGDTLWDVWHSERYRDLWSLHAFECWDRLPAPCRTCGSWDFLATERSTHLIDTIR